MLHQKIYSQLEELVLPLLKNYKTDLTKHDKNSIKDNTPFIHITRDTGTALIKFFKSEMYPKLGVEVTYMLGHAKRERILNDQVITLNHYLKQPHTLILLFDGKELKKVSEAKATGELNKYIRSMRNQWNEEKEMINKF